MEHKTIALSGVKVHYVEAGQGPVVLLLHGLGSSLDTWRRNVEPLADAGFTVLAPDLPGHGDSEKPDALDYGPRTAVDFTGQFLSALGVERASLVGNSAGGLVAALFALENPEETLPIGAGRSRRNRPPGFLGVTFDVFAGFRGVPLPTLDIQLDGYQQASFS